MENNKTKTPGYNCRLFIRFKADKNGKTMAHYQGGGTMRRWIKMSLDAARLFVAQDQADEVK